MQRQRIFDSDMRLVDPNKVGFNQEAKSMRKSDDGIWIAESVHRGAQIPEQDNFHLKHALVCVDDPIGTMTGRIRHCGVLP